MMPPGRGLYGPRGTVGRIYKEDHYTLLHTKFEFQSSGPCGFGEEVFFYVFPIICLWELMTPGVGPFLTPGAWLAGFIKRTTTHCYIQNMKALSLVVSEKEIALCFPIVSPWELSVAMEARVLIRPGPKPNATFSPPQ